MMIVCSGEVVMQRVRVRKSPVSPVVHVDLTFKQDHWCGDENLVRALQESCQKNSASRSGLEKRRYTLRAQNWVSLLELDPGPILEVAKQVGLEEHMGEIIQHIFDSDPSCEGSGKSS